MSTGVGDVRTEPMRDRADCGYSRAHVGATVRCFEIRGNGFAAFVEDVLRHELRAIAVESSGDSISRPTWRRIVCCQMDDKEPDEVPTPVSPAGDLADAPEDIGALSAADGADPVPDSAVEPDSKSRPLALRILGWAGLVLAAILLVVAILAIWPASTNGLGSNASPTTNYDQAVEQFEAQTSDEPGVVYEPCESQLLTHGESTDVVVVLFHGLTNCPLQFAEFGEQLFKEGANVLILRAPYHAIADSGGDGVGSVSNVASLEASDLRDYADDAVDIATGLGDEVQVLGLSMGGVVASWVGQNREDVDLAVAVAPALAIPGMPSFVTTAFVNFFDKVPNVRLPGRSESDHIYAGEATKGLVATFLLWRATQASAHSQGPAADEVVVVVNPDDDEADPKIIVPFAERWAKQDGRVVIVELPAVGLPHDVIDPDQPGGDIDLVYPILRDILDGTAP